MEEENNADKGLSSQEAEKRLEEYGENTVMAKKKIKPVVIFLGKFKNPLLILLITISIVSFFLGQKTSATIVMMMVFLSAILDFFNTYKSQKAVEKLASRVAIKVTVKRDGEKKEIDFKDIVPGDILFLNAGNIIPADSIVLESDDFFINQSALTGESIPVEKIPGEQKTENNNNELNSGSANAVFMGTSVITGYATVKVVKTGFKTKFGKIAGDLSKVKSKTDFELNITKFSLFVMKLIFYMVSFVFIVYLVKNSSNLSKGIILEAFTFALAITIGVTPDMLPAIITVCLSKGSQLMAKKEVIVKQLASIENFGSMDILCTDKTGTLTQDHIALINCVDYTGKDSEKVLMYSYLSSIYHTGIINPLDTAIKEYKRLDISGYEKIDEIPYDFKRKRSSMVIKKEGRRYLITKGAPEEIINICHNYELDNIAESLNGRKEDIIREYYNLSQEGFRVLGLCYKEIADDGVVSYKNEIEKEMVFIGFLAFLDPPKDDADEALAELNKLGIEVKILTGDSPLLAQKICRDIGLDINGIATGEEIEKMDDLELGKVVLKTNIFARIEPDQKERIILILKKSGKSVGYLGDGINDAPALRAADVGISVNNAADIAKDTADIILMQKSLESLKDGVIEGRKTFRNTLKYVLMGMSSNFGNMFSMMGAATFLPFLPMLPSQIVLNNFIYDVAQLSLPTDAVDEDELVKPAHWNLKFIRNYMIVFGSISSIFDFLTFILLYFVYHLNEHQFQTGWFIESIATQIFVIYMIRTKKIPFIKSRPSLPLFVTTLTAVIIAWLIPFTFFGPWLLFERLPLMIMAIIFSYVIIYLLIVEIAKRIFYHYHNKKILINN